MAEKTSWFGWLKRLFFSNGNTTLDKKSKKWRWFFRRVKVKQCPVVRAPSSTLVEAIQEQKKHALSVAMATAAAAEAAVAAAHAAAAVVRLAGASQSHQLIYQGDPNLAAIRIQSAFRAYLARKAFRALRGLVKLQAIARGRAVRHQIGRIKLLATSSGSSQSQFSRRKIPSTDESHCEMKQLEKSKTEGRDTGIKLEYNDQRNWDCSTYSKADIEVNWSRKQEGISKRERMKKYSYSHREGRYAQTLEESLSKECRRWSSRLEQFVESDAQNDDISLNTAKHDLHSKLSNVGTGTRGLTLDNMGNAWKRDLGEVLSTPSSLPRRSFGHGKRFSFIGEDILPSSPVFPTYMATTESAKAKVRSISMPKQRVAHFETCNRSLSSKSGLLFSLSYNGESSGLSRRQML